MAPLPGRGDPRDTPGSAAVLLLILFALWLLLSGHYTPFLLGAGAGCAVAVTALAWRMGVVDPEGVPIRLLPRALLYAPWLAKEVVKANLDVMRRILTPRRRPDISPRLFDVPTSQRSDLGRVLYANSITLTPGTVSVRVHGRHILVHAIAEDVADSLLEGEMDRKVTWLEGGRG